MTHTGSNDNDNLYSQNSDKSGGKHMPNVISVESSC